MLSLASLARVRVYLTQADAKIFRNYFAIVVLTRWIVENFPQIKIKFSKNIAVIYINVGSNEKS